MNAALRIILPDENRNVLRFDSYHKQLKVPYVIYADFETITTKIEGPQINPEQSGTRKTREQEPCGFFYVVVRIDGQTKSPVSYRGENVVEEFFRRTGEEESAIKEELRHPQIKEMKRKDWQAYNRAQDCHVCGQELDKELGNCRVKDHCHIKGKFRGAAHKKCNLK